MSAAERTQRPRCGSSKSWHLRKSRRARHGLLPACVCALACLGGAPAATAAQPTSLTVGIEVGGGAASIGPIVLGALHWRVRPLLVPRLAYADLSAMRGTLFGAEQRIAEPAGSSKSLRSLWFGHMREDDLRDTFGRPRALRRAAAGFAMTGGLAVVVAGSAAGGRRLGAPGLAPIADAGSQTTADLGVVMGSGVLLTSALMASLPLEGGVRRLRPVPIGGRRWAGAALRWGF